MNISRVNFAGTRHSGKFCSVVTTDPLLFTEQHTPYPLMFLLPGYPDLWSFIDIVTWEPLSYTSNSTCYYIVVQR